MITLETAIDDVPKISKRIVPALKRLGIRTIRDLLFHFPARYDDFSNVKAISELVAGETVTIRGVITKISSGPTAHKRMALTEATVQDESGRVKALWFNQPYLVRNLKPDTAVRLSGKVVLGKSGLFLSSPAHERIGEGNGIHTGGLVPIYPETVGITSRWMRFLISSFLPLATQLPDPLPTEMRADHKLPELQKALHDIHFPNTRDEAAAAQRRFTFEELLLLQLHALKERSKLKQNRAPEIPFDVDTIKRFVESLPFKLTDAQRKAMMEILRDMAKPQPMNRLLEGDVGSGKTVVAAAAAYMAARAGYQTALMAPTEILARQHFATFQKVFTLNEVEGLNPFNVSIGLLTGSEKHVSAKSQFDSTPLQEGRGSREQSKPFDIIIGTHALIQKKVFFEKLALIIIDEQHRFGVEQRAALSKKHESGIMIPHFLSMTATPIPRTLALTVYGDLDLSVLDEIPSSRKKIITRIVKPGDRNRAYAFIREEIAKGGQAFVVCPQIESRVMNHESRMGQQQMLMAQVKAVKQEHEKLSGQIFPDLHIAMLHGKLKPKEKTAIMEQFQNHKIDILVSTSVIEVGVDVPNANIMVIEGAERFGLAQLHQFRGRVGRGERQSYCLLMPSEDGMVTQRLKAIVSAKTGFELAEKDLQIRGPGSMFGTQQWGISDITLEALRNPKLIQTVREEAISLAKQDPTLERHQLLRRHLATLEQAAHLE